MDPQTEHTIHKSQPEDSQTMPIKPVDVSAALAHSHWAHNSRGG
jgi:hypothetical protein